MNIRDSSEEIACARELLTLGQNSVTRPSPPSPAPLNSVQYKTLPRAARSQRVIVEVPQSANGPNRAPPQSHPTSLNLDGNVSDNGSDTEEENEDVCKIISLSQVLLRRNSSPKSTVEDSCCYPAVLNKSNKKLFCWNKKKHLSKSELSEYPGSCNGVKEPGLDAHPGKPQLRSCAVSLPRLPAMSASLRAPDPPSDSNTDSQSRETSSVDEKNCDTILMTSMSSIAPTPTFIQAGPVGAPAGATYIMTPSQPQGQVLVFSGGGPTFPATAGTIVTSAGGHAGLQGNLVLVSGNPSPFPGQAMQMVPMTKGLIGPQTISIQPEGNVIKVPVGLNGGIGGMVIPGGVTLPQSPGLVTLSQPIATLQPQPQAFTLNQPAASGGLAMAQANPVLLQPSTTNVEQTGEADGGKVEPTYKEDGSLEWSCKVCFKVCATEHELAIHKKRHKIAAALVCPHCQRSYVDQHRYAVHVRIHTGETPYHCDLCGKGFRDDRKMKLHMARHNSGLSHKCHLCPRSFEGPKALEKHLKAHALGRYVAPKVIQRQDGTVAMALPDDPNQTKKEEGQGAMPGSVGGRDEDSDSESPVPPISETSEVSQEPLVLNTVASTDQMTSIRKEEADEDPIPPEPGMISLSVDDLYQYSVAQADTVQENVDIHDKLSEGASKIVPLGMDEFMTVSDSSNPKVLPSLGEEQKVTLATPVKLEKKLEKSENGEFPDLLDSDTGLASLSHTTFNYNQYEASDEKLTQLLKSTDTIKEESGLTFATLSGLDPVYPEVDLASITAKPVVVAKRSRAPAPTQELISMKDDVETIKSEVEAMHPQLTLAPLGVVQPTAAQDPSAPVFTIQYNLPEQPATNSVPLASTAVSAPAYDDEDEEDEDDDEEFDPPGVQLNQSATSSVRSGSPRPVLKASEIKPILAPVDPDKADPSKDCFTYTTKTGSKIEVPTIITGGYDFENLLCLFCDNQQFKNDKTLINHLLNHFGVAPKMATCPICNLSLQKKSFARHVRLHGDVQPEVCPYCKKEFREKRSLDKHIRAIHEAERPFPCEHCTESFRNQIELKNHINRHMKDYPFKCEVCSMTFQKQEALSTHYRLHTGEKPYICPICEKRFTSEKNKRVHVLRHQGSLPHKCEVCEMTFQSRSHLLKHATSHNRKTQVISAKINTFLESFGASLGEFGLDDAYEGAGNDISLHSATESGEIEDASIRLSVDNLPEPDNLEAAAAEAAFAFGNDLDDPFGNFDEEDEHEFATPEPPGMPLLASNTGSAPSLVNGMSEEEAEKIAKAELATEIPSTPDGTYLCTMCNTKLGNKRSYIIHLRRHAGMLNFKCKYCPKTFQGRVKLNRHMNTHSRDGGTPAQGAASNSQMPSASTSESTTMAADGKVIYNCAMCSKVFTDKPTLQEHTKMHLIEDAKAKFSNPASTKDKKTEASSRGQMKYSYTCNLCSLTFLDNERWKLHKTSHGNKTWKCKFCETLFEDRAVLGNHLHEIHSVGRDEMESMGLLKAIPLVIIKAVTENNSQDGDAEGEADSDEEDSEPEVDNPMPRHFDNTDEAIYQPPINRSRSNSPAVSLDFEASSTELRPSSACTDNSDTSVNVSFDNQGEAVDESNFDTSTLTCKLCNKVLKNLRTFRNHKARHMGTLSHKCPDCNKCFEGRSAVNRHLISNHNRELQPHEITNNPAAIMPQPITIKPAVPEIKLFKPSEMARKTFVPSQLPPKPAEGISEPKGASKVQSLGGGIPISPEKDKLFDRVISGKKAPEVTATKGVGQMPILLENPTQEVKYIVGAQLGDLIVPPIDSTEPEKERPASPEPPAPTLSEPPPPEAQSPEKSKEGEAAATERDSSPPARAALIPKLANIEKIIPESDNSSNSSDSDSSSSSDKATSNSDWAGYNQKKKGRKNPEEITIEDDDEVNDRSVTTKYHAAFRGFLQKGKVPGSDSEGENIPVVKKKRGRPAGKKSAKSKGVGGASNAIDDDITIFDPVQEEKEEKLKQKERKQKKVEGNLSDEGESSHGEGEILRLAEEAAKPAKKKRGRPPKKSSDKEGGKSPKKTAEAKADKAEKELQVEKEAKADKSTSSKVVNKVSMVAAIFRAKKASKGKDKVLDEGKTKAKKAVSETESEKEKGDTDTADMDKETQEENDKLMEQKGVKVVGDKMMIPADKLKIPEELCKMKSVGRGKAGKKMFVCQICEKQFNRADKIKYHLYNEHYDDFIRCSDSVPRILTKAYSPRVDKTPPHDKKVEEKEEKPTVISKPSALARIFKKKDPKKALPVRKTATAKEETPKEKEAEVESKEKSGLVSEDANVEAVEESFDKAKQIPGLTISPIKKEEPATESVQVEGKRSSRSSRAANKSPAASISPARPSPTEDTCSKSPDVKIESQDHLIPNSPIKTSEAIEFGAQISSRSPRSASSSPQVRTKSPRAGMSPRSSGRSPRGDNATVMLSKLSTPMLPNTSIILSPKTMFPTETPASESVQLAQRNSGVGEIGLTSGLASKTVSLQPRESEQPAPASFPFASMGEAKFGGNTDLVTFADLALKSKKQTGQGFPTKATLQTKKAKKIERKKISARVSLEQSNIEDTKALIALRAAREEEEDEEQSKPIEKSEGTQQTYTKEDTVETKEDQLDDPEEQTDARVVAALAEVNKAGEDESRATRSRLHVDTIGLTSSTLDLELHALRSLVFNDILGEGVEEFKTDSVRTEAEVERAELEELAMTKEDPPVTKEAIEVPEVQTDETSDDEDDGDLPLEVRSKGERFHAIRRNLPKVAGAFASKIWHERKRLRLKRSKELSLLREQQPEEKRSSFKPVRQEFSLELLCGNNQFDNILIEAGQILNEIQLQAALVKENTLFMSPKYHFSASAPEGLKLAIKRTTIESPDGMFDLIQNKDNRLVLRRAKPSKNKGSGKALALNLVQDEEKFHVQDGVQPEMDEAGGASPRSILKGVSQYDKEVEEKKEKVKPAKKLAAVAKKFKPTKVTWGAAPPPLEKKKKRKLKKDADPIVLDIGEKVEPTEEKESVEEKPEARVKRKYTKRSPTEGTGASQEEVPRTKRKYTKRVKVDDGEKSGLPPTLQVNPGSTDTQPGGGLTESSSVSTTSQPDVRVKRKYTKRKKPDTDSEGGDLPMMPKKRGRPKLVKSVKPVTEDVSKDPEQPEDAEATRPGKGRPKKLSEEDDTKCGQLDIQLIAESKLSQPALSLSSKPGEEGTEQCKEWSTEVLENVSKGVFDFEDNSDGTASYAAQTVLSQNKKAEGEDSALKIKRLETSSNSGDEQQVPLKITFKRPKQTEEEISSNVPRKSIKLRVKTQTTRDHGLKIQIRQPKTDNPLKFKVKTTKAKKAKKVENGSPTSTSTETSPVLTPTTASPIREQQPVTSESFGEIPDVTPEESEPMPDAAVEEVSGSGIEGQDTESPETGGRDLAYLKKSEESAQSKNVENEEEKDEVPQNVEMVKTGLERDTVPERVEDLIKEQLVSDEENKKDNLKVPVKEEKRKMAELGERPDVLVDPKREETGKEEKTTFQARQVEALQDNEKNEKIAKMVPPEDVEKAGKEAENVDEEHLAPGSEIPKASKSKDETASALKPANSDIPKNDSAVPEKAEALLIQKSSGLAQICSLYSDDEDAEDDEEEEEYFTVHPGLRPNKAEDKIGQLDGLEDIDELSDEEDMGLKQIDGTHDGFYKVSTGKVTEYTSTVHKSSVLVLGAGQTLAPTSSTSTGQTSSSAATPVATTTANTTSAAPVPGQIKRDRSLSDDGPDDGENPTKKKHQCHICSKLFPNSFRLKTHVRVHTGEKPFKCEPCAQAFADRSNYVKHKQTKTHRNKVESALNSATGASTTFLGSQEARHATSAPISRVIISHYGESGPPELDTSREVPQFDFLDSPGTPFNQHDLDSHVPIDGYDMDDVSLATEHYMFSSQMDGAYDLSEEEDDFDMFHSQVDGEQDLVEQSNKKNSNGGAHQNGVNGVSANGGTVKVESLAQLPGVQLLVNGSGTTEGGSILARHLGLVVTKAPRPESPERTFSCDMCSAKLKNKRNFETHMKRHRGELPFKCEECPKTFQGRRDLETHKRSRHDVAKKGVSVEKEDGDIEMGQPLLLSPVLPSIRQKTIVLNMNSLPTSMHEHMNTVLIKQDPVMVADHKDEPPDPETDFILQDSLPLFDNSLMESSDSAVNLSLDDLTSFTQPLGGSLSSSGLHQENSFDASMDGSASFLSGADMSTDTFELVGEDDNDVAGHINNHDPDPRNDSGGAHSPFTPRSGSATPSEEGDQVFPCPHCPDKRFGNRRNLMSHMRRHTGDYKLFCESCGKGFFTQSKLDSHKRKHTGEKPFRCLFKTCLKRFRYKGDLSKHIKRYHPGHMQPLTPVALQDDEIAALANAQQAAKQKSVVVSTVATTTTSTLRTVLTTGLRPSQLVLQAVPSTYRLLSPPNPATIIPDSDPSLDENLLNMLAADGEEDDPMLSPSTTAKTLAGLSHSNTALALPNTVFSSKPTSNQEVGVFLQSSGKSSTPLPLHLQPVTKTVILSSSSAQENGQSQTLQHRSARFLLPHSSLSPLLSSSSSSSSSSSYSSASSSSTPSSSTSLSPLSTSSPSLCTTSTSATLRSLLSAGPDSLPVSQALRLSPIRSKPTQLTTTFSPSLLPTSKMAQSFLPADISFTSDSGREGEVLSLPSDSVTLTLEDIMSYTPLPPLKDQQSGSGGASDRESDLTSPGSVRSEQELGSSAGESSVSVGSLEERLSCQFPACGRTFDRSHLLKRHQKLHSGEARFVCDVCKKSFESGSKLEDHYRRHTGERPFQCHVCGNKFRYKGDRTKHLKNLHGIHKSAESGNNHSSLELISNGAGPTPGQEQSQDKTPFMPSITEETSSSISSFQSNPEMSDGTSLSGSTVGESPTKFDPLEVEKMEVVGLGSVSASTNCLNPHSMSMEEVMACAGPNTHLSF